MGRPTNRGPKMTAPGKGNKIKKLIVNSVSRKYLKKKYFYSSYERKIFFNYLIKNNVHVCTFENF